MRAWLVTLYYRFLNVLHSPDWAPPGLGPEVPHPYVAHAVLRCCEHCGGGKKHKIHRPPFDLRREKEVRASIHEAARQNAGAAAGPLVFGGFYCQNCSRAVVMKQGDTCELCQLLARRSSRVGYIEREH